MSSEKRAESCLKIPQNSQKRFVQIRVIRGTSFAFFANFARENFVGLWKFFIFAIGERNKAFEFLTLEKEEQKETKNKLHWDLAI